MSQYDIAAYIWPAYTGDEPRTRIFWPDGMGEWQTVKAAGAKFEGHQWPRKPLWGYVNEADPYVMEMQIEAAVEHGVNVFIYDWYWYDNRPFLEKLMIFAPSSFFFQKKAEEGRDRKRRKNYVPKEGSSSYALLLGLFDAKAWKEDSAVEKTELIEKAKAHSDVPLEPPDCKKPATVFRPKQFFFYSGWGSIKTLIGNGLVLTGKRKGTRKTLYYLSVDGVVLAQKLAQKT